MFSQALPNYNGFIYGQTGWSGFVEPPKAETLPIIPEKTLEKTFDEKSENKKPQTSPKKTARERATLREKQRQSRLNENITKIKNLVCPNEEKATKSVILRHAQKRILYLENLYSLLKEQVSFQLSFSDFKKHVSGRERKNTGKFCCS